MDCKLIPFLMQKMLFMKLLVCSSGLFVDSFPALTSVVDYTAGFLLLKCFADLTSGLMKLPVV